MMKAGSSHLVAIFVILFSLLGGCNHSATTGKPVPIIPGSDRDQHGCIASAGYLWCAREAACVRPWELAQEKGFANSLEAFEAYCAGTPPSFK
jgi:hypothetical protein